MGDDPDSTVGSAVYVGEGDEIATRLRLIDLAAKAHRARLINATAPPLIQLPEADISGMEYFIDQMLIVLPVLGVNVFRQPGIATSPDHEAAVTQVANRPSSN